MFFEFVIGLVLVTLAFRLVTMVLAILPALFMAMTTRWRPDSLVRGNSLLTQTILSVVYSAVLAVVTNLYAKQDRVEHSWVYAISGFVGTYLVLAGGAHARMKELGRNPESRSPMAEGAAQGAALGLLIALVTYPIFYALPALVGSLPGVADFFGWVIGLSEWLASIWILRVLVVLVACAYVVTGAIAVLITMSLLVHGIGAASRRLFRGRRIA